MRKIDQLWQFVYYSAYGGGMTEEVATKGSDFDIDLLTEIFEKSLVYDVDVSLPLYIDAYRRINK